MFHHCSPFAGAMLSGDTLTGTKLTLDGIYTNPQIWIPDKEDTCRIERLLATANWPVNNYPFQKVLALVYG